MEDCELLTIKEIAEMAGVSRSTVSRALNNSGYVGEDARKRIEKVVKETGYVPNEQAKSLRTKQTKVIGVILPTIQTETSSKIVTGLGKELEKQGYQILLTNTNLDKDKEIEYLDLLKVRQVDGIILIATNTEPVLLQKIKELNIPFAMIGQEAAGIFRVTYADYEAGQTLTSLLINEGHEKIAFIGVDESDGAVGTLRKQGYLDEMATNHLSVEKAWVQKGVFDIDSGFHAMEKIMTNAVENPTAVFAVTDRLAIGALNYLKAHNFELPKDMSVVSIGGSELSALVVPALTTVDFQYEEAGRASAKQLLALIREEEVEEKMIVDYRLIIRDSV